MDPCCLLPTCPQCQTFDAGVSHLSCKYIVCATDLTTGTPKGSQWLLKLAGVRFWSPWWGDGVVMVAFNFLWDAACDVSGVRPSYVHALSHSCRDGTRSLITGIEC